MGSEKKDKSKKLARISAKKEHLGTKKGYLGAKQRPERAEGPKKSPSQGLSVQKRTIRVLLDSLVGNSAGISPLAGGSEIGISASDSGIPEISVGKLGENSWGEGN